MHTTTKDSIYSTALEMFSTRGYTATTVRDIAEEVGIRGASVYAHVNGKEQLLRDLVLAAAGEFERNVRSVFESNLDVESKLRSMIAAHIGVITRNIHAATIYFHEWKFLGPQRRRSVRERRDAYEAMFRQVISEGMDRKTFATNDPKFAAIFILSSCNSIPTWYKPTGTLTPGELGRMFAEMLVRGIMNCEV